MPAPSSDETGNFLITDRNANPIYDTDNTGCTIKLKWQPAPFYEPGLAYMQGVKDVIWEQKLFDGDPDHRLSLRLGRGERTRRCHTRRQGVGDRAMAGNSQDPYNNDTLRSFMFALLKAALKKTAAERTAAEKKLIELLRKVYSTAPNLFRGAGVSDVRRLEGLRRQLQGSKPARPDRSAGCSITGRFRSTSTER